MKTLTNSIHSNCTKKIIIVIFTCCTVYSNGQSLNIASGAGVSSMQMADSLFDSNYTVTGVTEAGDPLARGHFNNTGTNLPINNGIILSTGKAADANCPNNMMYGANTAFSFAATPDNDLLTIVAPSSTLKDLCKIEFDVIANADTLIFNYSFGSEEYLNYAPPLDMSGAYNDVFGIFISGPGISGTQNIATVPNTNTNVSVLTINPVFNTLYFINNLANLLLGIILPTSVQYNGFTKAMQAKMAVVKGQSYHIKIAIADMRDNIVDSGVFVKATGKNAGSVVLPVEMVSWSAKNTGASNILNWKTAAENNNSHFVVERSTDNKIFKTITSIKGNGTSNAIHEYQYEDVSPVYGDNYYRLKQVDFNESYKYSNIIMATVTEKILFSNVETYPNPANGNINIRVQSTVGEQGVIEILDCSGKKVFQQPIEMREGPNEFHCDIKQLPQGAYFVRLTSDHITGPVKRIFN